MLKVWWIKEKLDRTCWAFLLSVVALRRFSAPSLIFSSLRISLRIFSRCSSRSCCTPESEKSEFWSRPSCSRTDSPPGSLWMNKEETTIKSRGGGEGRTNGKFWKRNSVDGKRCKAVRKRVLKTLEQSKQSGVLVLLRIAWILTLLGQFASRALMS